MTFINQRTSVVGKARCGLLCIVLLPHFLYEKRNKFGLKASFKQLNICGYIWRNELSLVVACNNKLSFLKLCAMTLVASENIVYVCIEREKH